MSEDKLGQFYFFDDDAGDENESDLSVNPNSFAEAVIWNTDWTAETIVNQLKKNNIDMNPKFQRRDAWNIGEKSLFIESLFLGIPIPPIILAESKTKKNSYIVIDGKQRLTAILQFCSNSSPESNANLVFKKLKLSGLTVLKKLNGKSFSDIENDPAFDTEVRNFSNQTIRTVVIKNWPDEPFLYTVFLRLNTGSKKLSSQELRQALHPGEFIDFADDMCDSKLIQRVLRIAKPDSRMRDLELIVRYYANKYYLFSYNGDLKFFLDNTCKELNKEFDEEVIKADFESFENAIQLCFDIFGEYAFSKSQANNKNNRFNRAIFEVLTYYLADHTIFATINKDRELFKNKFYELLSNADFLRAIESSTKNIDRVVCRFDMVGQLINSIYSLHIPTLKLSEGKIKPEM